MWAHLLLLPGSLTIAGLPAIDGTELVRIARQTIVAQVGGSTPPPIPDIGPAKPVFVTIERNNRILGCRGSLVAKRTKLSEEVVDAARSATAHDPRYRPINRKDLDSFLVTVTLIERLESIPGVEGLRPEDGLVLKSGGKTGVVLPWEGKDPAIRLKWAYQKAGIPPGSSVTLQRLVAERWRG